MRIEARASNKLRAGSGELRGKRAGPRNGMTLSCICRMPTMPTLYRGEGGRPKAPSRGTGGPPVGTRSWYRRTASEGNQTGEPPVLCREAVMMSIRRLLLVAVMIFNRIPFEIPLPSDGFDQYIDFYGGWSHRVNMSTALRFVEIAAYTLVGGMTRGAIWFTQYRFQQSRRGRE